MRLLERVLHLVAHRWYCKPLIEGWIGESELTMKNVTLHRNRGCAPFAVFHPAKGSS